MHALFAMVYTVGLRDAVHTGTWLYHRPNLQLSVCYSYNKYCIVPCRQVGWRTSYGLLKAAMQWP